MAKITDLAPVLAITGDEFLPIVQQGTTKRATMSSLRALITPYLQNWYKGDRGDPGTANNTYTSYAALLASNPTRMYAYLTGDTDTPPRPDGPYSNPTGQPGAWIPQRAEGIRFRQIGYEAIDTSVGEALLQFFTVNGCGAVGDGVTDDAPAIQKAILDTAKRGGGEILFGTRAKPYFIGAPVYLCSNVTLNLNGQTLSGKPGAPLFRTATFDGATLTPIPRPFDPSKVVNNALIRNGRIINAGIAFDFRSWTRGCAVENVEVIGCRQAGVLYDCFYSVWRNITNTPEGSVPTHPTWHLASHNNAMLFDRVTCTTAWGWLVEGSSAGLIFNVVTYEGGNLGWKYKGPTNGPSGSSDAMGVKYLGCYFEYVPGKVFDLSEAERVWIDWDACHWNYNNICIDDGGIASTATIFGTMRRSNNFSNIGGVAGGITYPGRMRLGAPRNYLDFDGMHFASSDLSPPPNFEVSKHTRHTHYAYWNADGLIDIRAIAHVEYGLVPRAYSGDVGTPFQGTIPFSTITLPQGASVTATVQTQITLENDASVVHFIIAIADNVGPRKICGTIYGDFVDQRQGADRPVSIGQNAAGKLILYVGGINNADGRVFLTGTVYLGR